MKMVTIMMSMSMTLIITTMIILMMALMTTKMMMNLPKVRKGMRAGEEGTSRSPSKRT